MKWCPVIYCSNLFRIKWKLINYACLLLVRCFVGKPICVCLGVSVPCTWIHKKNERRMNGACQISMVAMVWWLGCFSSSSFFLIYTSVFDLNLYSVFRVWRQFHSNFEMTATFFKYCLLSVSEYNHNDDRYIILFTRTFKKYHKSIKNKLISTA